mmetsp:Transcript_6005/g.24787  ORF Transcript_6005/g.24787 Transcript_6005/m.24787 type:complete len:226 (-) Transcript_6005:88-765(-)
MASSCDTTTSNWPSTPGLGNLPPTTGFPGSSRLTSTTHVLHHRLATYALAPFTATAYAPSNLVSTRVPTNSGTIVGGANPMKSSDNRAGSTTTERELDISDTTYAVSSTTATARAPHSLPELSPRVASVEQSARCDTTRGLTRYRRVASVRHRSQRTSMSATCPKPSGLRPLATAMRYSPERCIHVATTPLSTLASVTEPATVGMSGRYTSTTLTVSTCAAATYR